MTLSERLQYRLYFRAMSYELDAIETLLTDPKFDHHDIRSLNPNDPNTVLYYAAKRIWK